MISLLVGTRPECLKMAPIARAFDAQGTPYRTIVIDQQPNLLPLYEKELGRVDITLPATARNASLTGFAGAALHDLAHLPPSKLLLVQGDTTSSLCGALAAYYQGIPVGHVEAGLRTWARNPFPEEMNRRLISQIAAVHFAPTGRANANLVFHGEVRRATTSNVVLTGNTSIDQLRYTLEKPAPPRALKIAHVAEGRPIVLITCHRREGWTTYLPALADALERMAVLSSPAGMAHCVWPTHPNPLIAGTVKTLGNVHSTQPLTHAEFVHVLRHASLVLTDSGGVIEEACALGVRTLILREETERQEAIEAGVARLVPLTEMPFLPQLINEQLALPRPAPSDVFGDGHAGERIAKICAEWISA